MCKKKMGTRKKSDVNGEKNSCNPNETEGKGGKQDIKRIVNCVKKKKKFCN